jgi:hypothetical protein
MGRAGETARFAVDGAEYEIDLSKKNARRSAASSHRSSTMPASPGGASATDPLRAGSI